MKRNATRSKNMKRRSGGSKKRRIEESWKSMHGKGACTLGMRILQVLLERGFETPHIEELP
jgi:hypothetical protein